MEDMIREENLLKVKDYIKHLDIKNYDSIANFDFLLDWIDINSIKLNYEEIIALINTDDYFKKMIFDVCSLDKINYDKLNLNEATFVKNMVRAYKIVQEVNSKESIEKKILNDEFREALINARLTDKEKFVILNRFGFIDGENHTLEEIGQMVGVTRERVRQIENKSIRKLRKDPKIKKFA